MLTQRTQRTPLPLQPPMSARPWIQDPTLQTVDRQLKRESGSAGCSAGWRPGLYRDTLRVVSAEGAVAYDISSRLAEIEARRRSMQLDLQTDLVASARAGMPSKRPFAAVPLEPNALSGSARAGMPSKRPFAAVPFEPNAFGGSARAEGPSKRPFAEAPSNADALWVDPDAAEEWVLPAQPAARPYQVDMAK